MTRARLGLCLAAVAALVAFIVSSACGGPPDDTVAMPALDPIYFQCGVQPLLLRGCSTTACHGDAGRALRLYSPSKLRAPGVDDHDLLTPAETCANQRSVQAFVNLEFPEASQVLTKPLRPEDGGEFHLGRWQFGTADLEYRCLLQWLAGGRLAPADETDAPPACRFDWYRGEDRAPLRCKPFPDPCKSS